MTDGKLIVICKDKKMGDDICKILVASEKISYADLEVWEEKTWDVKRKTGPINSRVLIVGDIKDTEPLSCFIDILYEHWGICYGVNMRYPDRQLPQRGYLNGLIAFLLTPAAEPLAGSDLRADGGMSMYYGERISEEKAREVREQYLRELYPEEAAKHEKS